jgi:hypothetical protein
LAHKVKEFKNIGQELQKNAFDLYPANTAVTKVQQLIGRAQHLKDDYDKNSVINFNASPEEIHVPYLPDADIQTDLSNF